MGLPWHCLRQSGSQRALCCDMRVNLFCHTQLSLGSAQSPCFHQNYLPTYLPKTAVAGAYKGKCSGSLQIQLVRILFWVRSILGQYKLLALFRILKLISLLDFILEIMSKGCGTAKSKPEEEWMFPGVGSLPSACNACEWAGEDNRQGLPPGLSQGWQGLQVSPAASQGTDGNADSAARHSSAGQGHPERWTNCPLQTHFWYKSAPNFGMAQSWEFRYPRALSFLDPLIKLFLKIKKERKT